MNKKWHEIKGYENCYLVNSDGQIYSLRRKKILKPYVSDNGYLKVGLYDKNSKMTIKYVHIIVAETFLEKNGDNLVVNHKDLDKANPKLENLEFVTQKENIYHSYINGRQKRRKGNENKLSKKVSQFDLSYNFIKLWDCVMDIERELNIGSNYVSNCALANKKDKRKKHKTRGFIFEYLED